MSDYSNRCYINPIPRRYNAEIKGLGRKLMELLRNRRVVTFGQAVQYLRQSRNATWIAAKKLEKEGLITVTRVDKASGISHYYILALDDQLQEGLING